MSDPKPHPNDALCHGLVRRMSPQQRLEKAVELSAMAQDLFLAGMRRRYPYSSEAQIRRRAVEHLYPLVKLSS